MADADLELLLTIFPNQDKEKLGFLLGENRSVDEVLQLLLMELDSTAEENDDGVLLLCSMFPNLDFEVVYRELVNADFKSELAVENLLKSTMPSSKPKIRLPKSRTSKSAFKWTPRMMEAADGLIEAFPQFEEESIRDIFEKYDGSVPQAAKELADIACRNDNVKQRNDELLSELFIMFPSLERNTLLALVQTGISFEEMVERILSMSVSGSGKSGTKNAWKTNALKLNNHETEPLLNFYHPQDDYSTILPVSQKTARGIEQQQQQKDPRMMREKAHFLAKERKAHFEKAAAAFKRGSLTGTSSASYYAQLGRELDLQVKHANKEASLAQIDFNKRVHSFNPSIIDLHGLTVVESFEYLQEKIDSWKREDGYLKVITGAGNHSKGKGKLLESSLKFIKNAGWNIDDEKSGSGWFYCSRRHP